MMKRMLGWEVRREREIRIQDGKKDGEISRKHACILLLHLQKARTGTENRKISARNNTCMNNNDNPLITSFLNFGEIGLCLALPLGFWWYYINQLLTFKIWFPLVHICSSLPARLASDLRLSIIPYNFPAINLRIRLRVWLAVCVHAPACVSLCAEERKWLCLFKLSTLSHVGQFSGNESLALSSPLKLILCCISLPQHPTHPTQAWNLLNGRLSFEG